MDIVPFELPQGSSNSPRNPWVFGVLILVIATLFFLMMTQLPQPKLLTDPFLQLPTETSVRVVWFTEFPGTEHTVAYGENLDQTVSATTSKLSRTREDQDSKIGAQTKENKIYSKPVIREVWRHEAEIQGLRPGNRVPYQVLSVTETGQKINSKTFTLAPKPQPGVPLKILLTSDHQLMPMTAANLQKVGETIDQLDAIFLAGDLVNIPDRASEWFDDYRGGAFFPCLQGRASYELEQAGLKTRYQGGELIQNVPLFPAIGNHEVMGRFSMETGLNQQYNDPYPKVLAEKVYLQTQAQSSQNNKPKSVSKPDQTWLKNNTFNSETYNEIFTLPGDGKNYYAVTFGDIRLVTLYITNIWRVPSLGQDARGRYREKDQDFKKFENWGYGQHIFEPIQTGSEQYNWLQKELGSPEFQRAKYKIVMFHHPPHSLGDNIVPPYTNPIQVIDRDASGNVEMIRYEYPKKEDYIIRDVIPVLEKAGVQLVYFGHSHLWNRFVSENGMHFLESSNVGNSYGAFVGNKRRFVPPAFQEEYSAVGDPNGLEPVVPTLQPLLGKDNAPQPYIASNEITAFSVLNTGSGTVSSYYFDTRKPDSSVIKFDEFQLKS
ncbi:MAG: metallophosphoesterase [Microcoleaceae cyanobacterium]